MLHLHFFDIKKSPLLQSKQHQTWSSTLLAGQLMNSHHSRHEIHKEPAHNSCAVTATRATSARFCRSRARVFSAGSVLGCVPRRTRDRAMAGVSRGCRKETWAVPMDGLIKPRKLWNCSHQNHWDLWMFICLSGYLSICLSVYLPTCLPIYLSI